MWLDDATFCRRQLFPPPVRNALGRHLPAVRGVWWWGVVVMKQRAPPSFRDPDLHELCLPIGWRSRNVPRLWSNREITIEAVS